MMFQHMESSRPLTYFFESSAVERARDGLHLRRTVEPHVPEVQVQVKCRRRASLSNRECQLYPRRSRQQQVPVVDFQAELGRRFFAGTPSSGESSTGTSSLADCQGKKQPPSTV
ncbi:SNRPN upstream reading frame protein-like [Panthera pardus]|uniref:SNRPN upstream reading frame protein-like n=1 Tax=Panthera pardus TaxID=9691 RepID=A0A9W2ULG2_PANPR|nr:SNRPN upstream reading frame protein-like [Panthera pardus]